MGKGKSSFAVVLACVFLLFCVFSYNLNISALGTNNRAVVKAESHTVCLEASFAQDDDIVMHSTDGVNFATTIELGRGNYQFKIIDNGTEFGHPGTIYDTTSTISTSGWKLSDEVNAKCTLLATGGNYTFAYNTETNKVQVFKGGFATPDEAGESLKLNIGNISMVADMGDKITCEIYLKADKAFEDIQSILSYNEDKLQIIKSEPENEALYNCPNLEEAVYNCDYSGVVAANASRLEGYDFTSEKLFLRLDFTVVGTGETNIEFTVQEMTVVGGEESYFIFSSMCADGVSLRGNVEVTKFVNPTEPETSESTEPTETTSSVTTEPQEETTASVTATEPTETPVATSEATDPSEEVTTEETTAATEPVETTAPAVSDKTETSEATVPSTSEKTEPTETTTETETESTAPEAEFELGDVNCDGKLNIRDATLIQKFLAKMVSLTEKQLTLADINTDDKVNIKDATYIQKKIANLL